MRYFELTEARLNEYNQEKTIQALGPKIYQVAQQDDDVPEDIVDDQDKTVKYVLSQLEKCDPTKNKTYGTWLAREYIRANEPFMSSFLSRVEDVLPKYVELKQIKALPPGTEDIGKLTFKELRKQLYHVPDADEVLAARKGEAIKAKGDYEEMYNGADCRIVWVKDKLAAKYYGRHTKWCTTGEGYNMFDQHSGDGPIYILMPKHPEHEGEKYQFQATMDLYANELDKPADLRMLIERFPGIVKCLGASKVYPALVTYLNDPSKVREAIKQDFRVIRYTDPLSLEDYLYAVECSKSAIHCIPDPAMAARVKQLI